jgi:hypothetical protein
LLVNEAPRVVPKSELHERLWPGTFASDATLVGLVKERRRALDDRMRGIRSSGRVGYAFSANVDQRSSRSPAVWHWVVAGERRIRLRDGENPIGGTPHPRSGWTSASAPFGSPIGHRRPDSRQKRRVVIEALISAPSLGVSPRGDDPRPWRPSYTGSI